MIAIYPQEKNTIVSPNANQAKETMRNFVPDSIPNINSKSERAASSLSADFDTFIKLLTTQVKNQDPTEPMDVSKMTEQIVQFSLAEQSVNTNRNLEKLIDLNQGRQFSEVSSIIGKNVTHDAAQTEIKTGGRSTFSYILKPTDKQEIVDTKLRVINQNGIVVRNVTGKTYGGEHNFAWDGLDDNQRKVPSGKYRLQVDAIDKHGHKIVVDKSKRTGLVEEAYFDNGEIILKVGGVRLPINDVKAIKNSSSVEVITNKQDDVFKTSNNIANAIKQIK